MLARPAQRATTVPWETPVPDDRRVGERRTIRSVSKAAEPLQLVRA
jgi:hypothetical protein